MRIISERRIREFSEKYSDAALAVANWMRVVRAAAWRTQADLKVQFHDSDLVGDKTVFNIANNHYRLVAYLGFRTQIFTSNTSSRIGNTIKGNGNNEHTSFNRGTVRY